LLTPRASLTSAIAPLSPRILTKPSQFRPSDPARIPQNHIQNAAAFPTRLRSSSVNPNSLGDQQHGSPQPFLASGVPINAYDISGRYRKRRQSSDMLEVGCRPATISRRSLITFLSAALAHGFEEGSPTPPAGESEKDASFLSFWSSLSG